MILSFLSSIEKLFGFYFRPRFAFYALVILVLIGGVYAAIHWMEGLQRDKPNSDEYQRMMPWHRFCYAALSGIVGAQSVLFAKTTAELVINSFAGHGFLFGYPMSYTVILSLGVCIFGQVFWMNSGLRRFDALYIVPVFQSFWIIGSVIGGLVFFGEYGEMTAGHFLAFSIGVILTIVGVFFLSQKNVSARQSHESGLASASDSQKDPTALGPYSTATTSDSDLACQEQSPLLVDLSAPHMHLDPRIGFLGRGVPAVFGGASMARCATVFTQESRDPGDEDAQDIDSPPSPRPCSPSSS